MNIHETFSTLRRVFYPQWDKGGEWALKVVPHRHPSLRDAYGRCDHDTRTIYLNEFQLAVKDPEQLSLTLIHEIAHAVTEANHRELWLSEMKRVAMKAEEVGRTRLATMIRKQIREHQAVME